MAEKKQSEEKDTPQSLTDLDNDADLFKDTTEEDPDCKQQRCDEPVQEGVEKCSGPTANHLNHGKEILEMGKAVQEMKVEFKKQMEDLNAKILELRHHVMKKDIHGSDQDDIVEEVVDEKVLSALKLRKNIKAKTHRVNSKITELPSLLKLFYTSTRHELKDGLSIKIPLHGDVFGDEETQFEYIFFNQIKELCELEPIGASCICAYVLCLYKECKKANLLHRFRFVNPHKVSQDPSIDQSQKSITVGQRLIGTLDKQLVLMPCNVGYVKMIDF
ncbi:uncharacterized protein LOC131006438 [Salvia miltiorrhiza]|uniref:uncharacterized protein LOC131006438 n=1 Tax=Salvia miltiorrhiza TaxID=226208 RepID=UPI0025ACA8EC|nr:uncharacterized protein LOC131006438 [Salvia miltiorrhiza]